MVITKHGRVVIEGEKVVEISKFEFEGDSFDDLKRAIVDRYERPLPQVLFDKWQEAAQRFGGFFRRLAPSTVTVIKSGILRIGAERARQVMVEGWTTEHDDAHTDRAMVRAAIAYALPEEAAGFWPWDWSWFKPSTTDQIRNLEKAGALIAAEIDRLQRAGEKVAGKP